MSKLMGVFVFAMSLSLPGWVLGGTSDYEYVQPDVDCTLGSTVDVAMILNSAGGDALDGLSVAICHNSAFVDIGSDDDVAIGAALEATNDGDGPDFAGIQDVDADSAWTVGVIVALTGGDQLDPADGLELFVVTYSGDAEGTSDLEFCTAGSPPVSNVVVAATEITPDFVDGSITVIKIPPPLPFNFIVSDESVNYNPEDGIGAFTAEFSIREDDLGQTTFPTDTAGFSFGVAHDGSLLDITAVEIVGELAALNDGDGPDFAGILGVDEELGAGGPGFTIGCVYALTGGASLEFSTQLVMLELDYSTVPAALIGDLDGAVTELEIRGDLGDPPVDAVVVVEGGSGSSEPSFDNGTITLIAFVPPEAFPFIRGDANDDGRNNIADGIWIISELFRGGAASSCFAAADANNDNKKDLTDAVFIIEYQFLDGPPPPAPFPGCGLEVGQVFEDCAAQDSCL